jgi:5-hydroxytryptamine receptor 1
MKLVLTMILVVWLSSALISLPVIIWNTKSVRAIESTNLHTENANNNKIPLINLLPNQTKISSTTTISKLEEQIEIICDIPHDKLYRIYSSSGTFYVPLFIMTFVYVRIFLETKRRLHERAKAAKKLAKSMAQSQNQQISNNNSQNFCYSCFCCCCLRSNNEIREANRNSDKNRALKNEQEPELDKLNEEPNKNKLDELCLDNETSSPSINNMRNNNQNKNADKLVYVDANEDSENFQTKKIPEFKEQTPNEAVTSNKNLEKKVSIKTTGGDKNCKIKKNSTTTSAWVRDNANTGITLQQRQKISLTRERRAARTLGIIMGNLNFILF